MTSTAIESKLIREGGTTVTLGGAEYHFKPYTDGAHVCEVENTEHTDRLLAITDGFRLYRGAGLPLGPLSGPVLAAARAAQAAPAPADEPAASPVPTLAVAPEILLGGDYPANFIIHGVSYQLGTIVAQAFAKADMNVAGWNAQPQEARDALIEGELNALDAAGEAAGGAKRDPEPVAATAAAEPAPVDPDTERAALVAEYTTLVGKKPHYNVGIAKLREMLEAERENAAKHAAEAAKQE